MWDANTEKTHCCLFTFKQIWYKQDVWNWPRIRQRSLPGSTPPSRGQTQDPVGCSAASVRADVWSRLWCWSKGYLCVRQTLNSSAKSPFNSSTQQRRLHSRAAARITPLAFGALAFSAQLVRLSITERLEPKPSLLPPNLTDHTPHMDHTLVIPVFKLHP